LVRQFLGSEKICGVRIPALFLGKTVVSVPPQLAQLPIPRHRDCVITELCHAQGQQLRIPPLTNPPVEILIVLRTGKDEDVVHEGVHDQLMKICVSTH
jgi:hypothetical protein